MKRIFALAAFLLFGAGPALAGGSGLEAMVTSDDGRGWEGVGRLNIGGRSFCTGALISESLVLTAAHCLYDRDTGKPYDASEIEFLAGWIDGRAAAYRGARRAVSHPSYSEDGQDRSMDVALVELDRPVRNSGITPFATGNLPALTRDVGVVSYAHDRAEHPSIQNRCLVLGRAGGTLVLDCNVDFGASGAPIFDMSGDTPRIVSVVSAKAMSGGAQVSLGTSLEDPLADLRAILAESDGVFSRARPAVTVMGRDEAVSSTGAKFIRP
ncbi:trypsin-like serine peptidase [Sinisalibacter aestuarii]|uniref:Serine protease n=1 Tax=Sinisalibacter aestuarii TaxID=2949426 RepID=A0ABQ5LTH5_9RHOB|nr:trypsin-like serine protease [Sinisalibacter aestuarii]GKY88224.1 serine protease [Sinisalibacter aestuarii]